MPSIAPLSFPGRMLPPLDALAGQLLQLKQYGRLQIVAELLSVFSSGAWDRIADEDKDRFLRKLEDDFNIRGWDDWEAKSDDAYSRICALIAAEAKGLAKKK